MEEKISRQRPGDRQVEHPNFARMVDRVNRDFRANPSTMSAREDGAVTSFSVKETVGRFSFPFECTASPDSTSVRVNTGKWRRNAKDVTLTLDGGGATFKTVTGLTDPVETYLIVLRLTHTLETFGIAFHPDSIRRDPRVVPDGLVAEAVKESDFLPGKLDDKGDRFTVIARVTTTASPVTLERIEQIHKTGDIDDNAIYRPFEVLRVKGFQNKVVVKQGFWTHWDSTFNATTTLVFTIDDTELTVPASGTSHFVVLELDDAFFPTAISVGFSSANPGTFINFDRTDVELRKRVLAHISHDTSGNITDLVPLHIGNVKMQFIQPDTDDRTNGDGSIEINAIGEIGIRNFESQVDARKRICRGKDDGVSSLRNIEWKKIDDFVDNKSIDTPSPNNEEAQLNGFATASDAGSGGIVVGTDLIPFKDVSTNDIKYITPNSLKAALGL